MTFKQAKELGAHVRKGEEGTPLPRKGRVMRPALCSAFHGWCQGRTPCSNAATM
jgi:hypothetical protein